MQPLQELSTSFREYLPFLVGVALVCLGLWAANYVLLQRRKDLGAEAQRPRQILMLALTALGLFLLLLVLPMSEGTRGSLLSLIGLVLTGVIALSSTSFVSNIMAGLMLRGIRSFGPGDFIGVAEKFGRVTERGLLHTEIQTEDRSLTTFPNFYLVSNPVHVVRRSGTILSSTVSLGYDLDRERIEKLLLQAAEAIGLEEPFVRILELGDFSVTYRVSGMFKNVRRLFTARSDLQKSVFDTLHAGGVEIVSPHFMNQRRLAPEKRFIPYGSQPKPKAASQAVEAPEDRIFDKAEEAEEHEKIKQAQAELVRKLHELQKERKAAEEPDWERLDKAIATLEARVKELTEELDNYHPTDGND